MQSALFITRIARHWSNHIAHTVAARPLAAPDDWRFNLASIVVFGALAGASVGTWTGGWQLFYVATKVPLLLLGTLLIGLPAMVILGRFIGCPLALADAARLALASIARTAVVLGALAPATAYLAFTLPVRGIVVYRAVVLSQVFAFAVAGFVGVTALRGRLAAVVEQSSQHTRIVVLWMAIYSFVGAQLTWVLRPFLGNPGAAVEYLRPYTERLGLNSNFYTAVFTLLKHSLGW
ncbi:MAG: hypothetical protein HY231_11810 [Acidobacteria bacterium]|nr:hypothetical protein [Acidobacteriota bacterium]